MTEMTIAFDYSALDQDQRALVTQKTSEIKGLVRTTADSVREIGFRLQEVKACLAHGQFGRWLEGEFGWDYSTATRMIQVAERFGQIRQIDEFAPSALYLLSAPATPAEAVAEAVERAGAGERITHAEAKRIIAGHQSIHQALEPLPPGKRAEVLAALDQQATADEAAEEPGASRPARRPAGAADQARLRREQIDQVIRLGERMASILEGLGRPGQALAKLVCVAMSKVRKWRDRS